MDQSVRPKRASAESLTDNLNLKRLRPRVAVLSSVHEALDPRIFQKQARTLATAGFDVHLLARHRRDEIREGIYIHALPETRSRWGRPAQWARLVWRAWRLRPQLIHIHDPELLPLLLLLRLVLRAAAVYDAHEYYGEEVTRRRWIPARLRRPAARLTTLVETFTARRIDAVVAVNEHMAAGFHRRGARAVAVHNFPTAEYFGLGEGVGVDPPPNESHPAEKNTVGYIGLLSPDRGLATVYEATRLLRTRLPEARVRVIGRVEFGGRPASVPSERAAWSAMGVELAGTIPAAEIPAALGSIAVGWVPFLDTGNNRRTIPLKLLEYMAAGRPVVASKIGYIAEIVRESGCGMLAPPGDAAAHAEALATLLTDRELARRMGEAGRMAVRTRYTWEGEGEKLVALYRRILGVQASAESGSESQPA